MCYVILYINIVNIVIVNIYAREIKMYFYLTPFLVSKYIYAREIKMYFYLTPFLSRMNNFFVFFISPTLIYSTVHVYIRLRLTDCLINYPFPIMRLDCRSSLGV